MDNYLERFQYLKSYFVYISLIYLDTQGTQIKLMMKELLQTKKTGPAVSKSSVESTHVQKERSEGEVVETGYIRSAGEVTHNSVRHEIIDVNTDEVQVFKKLDYKNVQAEILLKIKNTSRPYSA